MKNPSWQKELLRELEKPLPLVPQPFAILAQHLGVTEQMIIDQIHQWLTQGIIRRFGARVAHHQIGFTANGMSVWKVPEERLDEVGEIMIGFPEITHCYVRESAPNWHYNLYAMIHGNTQEEVKQLAQKISAITGIKDYEILYTVHELKKSTPVLFADQEEQHE